MIQKPILGKTDAEKGMLALAVLTVIYASMNVWARYLGQDFLIFQQVYLRFSLAFFLSLIIFRKKLDYSKLRTVGKRDWLLLSGRGLLTGLAVVCLSLGALNTKIGNVAFIQALPFVAFFGILFFKEKLTIPKALLILLSLAGVLLIAVPDYNNIFQWGRGELYALLGSAIFALVFVSRKWHSENLNNYELSTAGLFFQTLPLIIISVIVGEGMPQSSWDWGIVLVLLIAGVANIFNINLSNYGFSKVKNIVAGNILTLEVVFGALFGYLLYREVLTMKEVLGGLFIVASVIGMNRLTYRNSKIKAKG